MDEFKKNTIKQRKKERKIGWSNRRKNDAKKEKKERKKEGKNDKATLKGKVGWSKQWKIIIIGWSKKNKTIKMVTVKTEVKQRMKQRKKDRSKAKKERKEKSVRISKKID